ncbi:MAG: hypothetical protein WCF28_07985 [Methanobacterium sp.]|uniref:hypothetical protein n=1 Tax=Methanobacterium sp. TaxID=2164 RepID=UPI003C70BF12
MNQKKIINLIAAFLTFIVVGFIGVMVMFYLKNYPLNSPWLQHQFLVTIAYVFGIIVASYVYTNLQGDDKSSWLYPDKKDDEDDMDVEDQINDKY